jgi:hypothetical protein
MIASDAGYARRTSAAVPCTQTPQRRALPIIETVYYVLGAYCEQQDRGRRG